MAPDDASEDPPVFDALLRPHRSLSRGHGVVVATCLVGATALIGGVLAAAGAWPVLGFAGAEVALACTLLLLHGRAGRSTERILLTERSVHVVRTDAYGRVRASRWPSAWLRVALEERRGTVPALYLQRRLERIEIGRALGEAAKREVGRGLAEALARVRTPSHLRTALDEARAEKVAPTTASRL